jgi:transposase
MEREEYLKAYQLLRQIPSIRPRGCIYHDRLIVACYFWATFNDRPVCWATQAHHWPDDLRPAQTLPSQSAMSRRLDTASVNQLIEQIRSALIDPQDRVRMIKTIDSKPLAIGAYSKVKDARWGEGCKTQQRGYKLHVLWGNGPMPIAFDVAPMNASETRVGKRLVRHLGGVGYLLADSAYDHNWFYACVQEQGHHLVARRKRPFTGLGNRPHHIDRLRAIELLETPHAFGRQLYKLRSGIERQLAALTNHGGGLFALPNWVRWLPKVKRHIAAKLIQHALRYVKIKRLAA